MGFGLSYVRRAVGSIASIPADLRVIAQAAAALPRIEEQLRLLTESIAMLPELEERLAAVEQMQRSLAGRGSEVEEAVRAMQTVLAEIHERLEPLVNGTVAPAQAATARVGGLVGRFGGRRSRPAV